MKRFIASLAILLWFSPVYATHFFRNNASNINSGILNPLRLDPSSVTLQGNNFNLNSLNFVSTTGLAVADLSNSTSSLFLAQDRLKLANNIVVVGTSATRGAEIIGTKTEVFNFALATATQRGGGRILIQNGDYIFNSITTATINPSARNYWLFEPSATVKFGVNEVLNTVFIASDCVIEGLNVDVATASYKTHGAIIQVLRNAQIIKPRVRLFFTETTTLGNFSVFDFNGAIDSILDTPIISSFTIQSNGVSSADSTVVFKIRNATRCVIIEPQVRESKDNPLPNSNAPMFDLGNVDQFRIIGGRLETKGRILGSNSGQGPGTIRGFMWTNPEIISYANPGTNGLIYMDSNGGTTYSSGTVLSGFKIFYNAITSNPTLMIGAGAATGSIMIDNWVVYHTAGTNTGGGFTVGSGGGGGFENIGNIFTSNKIWGGTGCFSDAGINTRWAGNDNFCNGAEQ